MRNGTSPGAGDAGARKAISRGAGNTPPAERRPSRADLNADRARAAHDEDRAAPSFTVTFFRSASAKKLVSTKMTFEQLRDKILGARASTKRELPWLKFAIFGTDRTADGSLRNDRNVRAITGVEIDYDGGQVSIEEAIEFLRYNNICALIYTTPSHTRDTPRWRVLCPTSRELPPSERAKLVARVNGVLGGVAGRESFTLSQAYYYGSVGSGRDHRVDVVEGDFIDVRDDLDAAATGAVRVNPFLAHAAATVGGDRVDVEALLGAMEHGNIHDTQLRVSASMLSSGHPTDEVVARLIADTRAAAGVEGAAWDWDAEERAIRRMCHDWLRKHPEVSIRRTFPTDLGNARQIVQRYGADLRYVHEWRTWLVWQGGHWHRDGDGRAMRIAKATVEDMFKEAANAGDDDARRKLRKHAMDSQSARRLSNALTLAETEIEVVLPAERLDADRMLLGVQNGVVDLQTGAHREASREDYVTKRAGAAFDRGAICPGWMAFLQKVIPDDELVRYVQRAIGYVLTGRTVEEVVFVLWGTGANGKSTFRETVFDLLGDYAVGADASLLVTKRQEGATPDLARLHGRRLVTINETQQSDVLNEARLKFITGGNDILTARNLYENPFDFRPTHKTILTTNHKPIVRGTDEGIWRRLHLIPFIETIPPTERDPHFRERVLVQERSGILNWALQGLGAYQERGLDPPAIVKDATNEYREDMDIIGRWIEEQCIRDAASKVATAALYADYADWARDEIGFSISVIQFGRDLASRGFEKVRLDSSTKGVRGLRLRNDFAAQFEAATRPSRRGG